jgi:hypothetical protein
MDHALEMRRKVTLRQIKDHADDVELCRSQNVTIVVVA